MSKCVELERIVSATIATAFFAFLMSAGTGASSEPSPSTSPSVAVPGDCSVEIAAEGYRKVAVEFNHNQYQSVLRLAPTVSDCYQELASTGPRFAFPLQLFRASIMLVDAAFAAKLSGSPQAAIGFGTQAQSHVIMNNILARALTIVAFAFLPVIGSIDSATANPLDAQSSPSKIGRWAEPFEIRVIAIHSVLLQNGKVLFWEYHVAPNVGSLAGLWNPATGALTDVTIPYERDAFCAGELHLPDGRVMVIGGQGYHAAGDVGVKETDFFDPMTEKWTKGPLMNQSRWYPSAIELPDGSVLALGGQHNDHYVTKQVEHYDVASNTFTQLPPRANLDIGLFPRAFIMPSGVVFRAGDGQDTEFFDTVSQTWHFVDNFRVGGRYDGNMVLLPGLKKVLAIGGSPDGTHATATVEIIDTTASHPKWRYTTPMHHARVESNATLLPDGTVLIVGGGFRFPYKGPVKVADLFDPTTETWTEMAVQKAPRIYHSTALLLPDGRVFSAGSDDPTSKFTTKAEIYSPPYLFKGARPTINAAPSHVTYNASFSVGTPDSTRVARVVLIKLGATTHATNFDQRYLALKFQRDVGKITAVSPAGPTLAPPGWYMLFLVDGYGVPSVARMIWIG